MARSDSRRSAAHEEDAAAAEEVDPSMSQAQDIDWDAVGYDDGMDAVQSASERRRLQREMRSLIRQTTTEQTKFYETRADVVQTVLKESAGLLQQTRQTTEAAIDAALVIRVSELAYKRTAHFLADRSDDTGVSLDDFVARCADYMRFGRGIAAANSPMLSHAQRKRRRIEAMAHRMAGATDGGGGGGDADEDKEDDEDAGDDNDDDDDDDDGHGHGHGHRAVEKLDWAHFGQYACLPRARRPGLARFLPRTALSAEEKTRIARKRTAALRLDQLQEVRPQVLRPEDISVSQNSDLTALATSILQQLVTAVEQGQAAVQREYDEGNDDGDGDGEDEDDEASQRRLQQLMDRHGLRSDGGVDLIRFALNPQSFAQTVENFFYISFLVRDGKVGLAYDDNGLPSIYPISDDDIDAPKNGHEEDTQKHQVILSLDMAMWREMIATFNIRRSMIAHRENAPEAHPGGRAWFS